MTVATKSNQQRTTQHTVLAVGERAAALIHVARRGLDVTLVSGDDAVAQVRDLSGISTFDLIWQAMVLLDRAARAALDSETLEPEDQDALLDEYAAVALEFLERCVASGFRGVDGFRSPAELEVLPFLPRFEEGLDELERAPTRAPSQG